MKKLLVLVLALCLTMASFAALAEFPDGKKDVYFFYGDGWLLSALCCLEETVLHPCDRESGPRINAGCRPVFDDGDHAAYLAAHPEIFDCENWTYEE